MNKSSFSILGWAFLASLLIVFSYSTFRADEEFQCCPPPALNPAAPRFLQGAHVTVYLDTTSGFTPEERVAIKTGLENWNNQSNNSGVTYTVVETDNPPAPGNNNTIIATYHDTFATGNGGSALTMTNSKNGAGLVTNVHGVLGFWKNIRSGTPSLLMSFLRTTARHEGGHGIGLENSNTNGCAPGSNIMYPSDTKEEFITACDNAKIDEDPLYSATPEPTPPGQLDCGPYAMPDYQNGICF